MTTAPPIAALATSLAPLRAAQDGLRLSIHHLTNRRIALRYQCVAPNEWEIRSYLKPGLY
jgi:hypothetical protein